MGFWELSYFTISFLEFLDILIVNLWRGDYLGTGGGGGIFKMLRWVSLMHCTEIYENATMDTMVLCSECMLNVLSNVAMETQFCN